MYKTIIMLIEGENEEDSENKAELNLTENFPRLEEIADHFEVLRSKTYQEKLINHYHDLELSEFKKRLFLIRERISLNDEILFEDDLFRQDCRNIGNGITFDNIIYDSTLSHIGRYDLKQLLETENLRMDRLYMVEVQVHLH